MSEPCYVRVPRTSSASQIRTAPIRMSLKRARRERDAQNARGGRGRHYVIRIDDHYSICAYYGVRWTLDTEPQEGEVG